MTLGICWSWLLHHVGWRVWSDGIWFWGYSYRCHLGFVFSWPTVQLQYVALLYFIHSRTTTIVIASFFCINKRNSQICMRFANNFEWNLLTAQFYKSVDLVKDTDTYRKQATQHHKEPQAFNRQELPRRNWYVVLCSAGQPAIVADQIYVKWC